jgi:transcriptional regulator of acetoin/glycerol metabolism
MSFIAARSLPRGDTILLKDLPPEIRDAAVSSAVAAPPVVPVAPAAPAPEADSLPADIPAPVTLPVAAPVTPPPAAREIQEAPSPSPLSLDDALDFVYARLKEAGKEPVLERLEREMITRVLKDENGNMVRASERLGMTRTTLRKRIDAFGLRV